MKLIDLHTHLLPTIDDSKLKEQDFERLFEIYKKAGFSKLAFTPHLFNPYVHTKVNEIWTSFNHYSKIAKDIGIECSLGSELYYSGQSEIAGIPIALKYQLIEFPTTLPPKNIVESIKKLLDKGIGVIIAHVERYPFMKVGSPLLNELRELPVLFQVNVDGLEAGKAIPFVEEKIADFLTTDNHGDFTLPERYLTQLSKYPYLMERMDKLDFSFDM